MADSIVEELARKRLGRTIKGKWRLDRLIGVGGMAAVYAATHRNGARVALKMLHPTISASTQIRARFVREGYLANKVDHAGVVRVLDDDIDDTDGAAFLVMDLVVGTTLADRAMERLLDAGEVLDVADQVLQVLVAAHDKGIVHRDLKPDNLLVDAVGKVHVLDFGIARLLDDGNPSSTKTGTAFGTPGFMAPEQALGKQHLISPRTDLYALGATLFALVCGDFVHAAENPQELLVLVATQPARSLGELAPHMDPAVVAIIDKSTKNLADERWASAQAMLDEVRRVKRALGVEGKRVLPLNAIEDTAREEGSLSFTPPPLASSPPSEERNLFAPRERLSNPDAFTLAPLGTSEALARNPSDATRLDATSPLYAQPPRRRLVPVAFVFGGALLLGIVALVIVSTRGRREPDESSTSSAAPKPEKPSETATTAATELATAAAPTATVSASASSTTTATALKPGTKLPKSKPGALAVPATSGKKIDLGY